MNCKAATSVVRSEVRELQRLLRDPYVEADPDRKRAVLCRVIAAMTTGIDTSDLFAEMILACATTDLVSKKLVYLYLSNHAESNPDVALLCVNTLTKECEVESPIVRGLALRSLASLRLPQLFSILFPVLKRGFADTSSYVRKTACICALKVFRVSPSEFHEQNFFASLVGLLRDRDALVSANALAVVTEVSQAAEENGTREGLFHITRPVLYGLLNRLRDIPEWQRIQVIHLIHRYTPSSEEEMFDMMNLLEEHLLSLNSSVILEICHVFFYLTQNHPAVHIQVFERLKIPLLTLTSSSLDAEVSYAVLCHIKLLVQREPSVFRDDYKAFYCHYNEPTYVKAVKMEILGMLADTASSVDIINELAAYASERCGVAVTRAAVEAMGSAALRLPSAVHLVLTHFASFLEIGGVTVRETCLVVMRDLLRGFRDITAVKPILDSLTDLQRSVGFTNVESRLTFVWLLGEFGEYIEEAPYIMEEMCDKTLLSSPPELCRQFITAAVVLFFKRPPEMQLLLGRMFKLFINDFSNADVHDQALLYYRLLKQDPASAFRVICCKKTKVTEFVEDKNAALHDKLFDEFNSLAVVYCQPSKKFLSESISICVEEEEEEEEEKEEEKEVTKEREPEGRKEWVWGDGMRESSGTRSLSSGVRQSGVMSHEEMSTGVRGSGGVPDMCEGPQTRLEAPGRHIVLSADADIEPAEFQRRWEAMGDRKITTAKHHVQLHSSTETEKFERALEENGVFVLASGMRDGARKYYFYAQEEEDTETYFLVELFLMSDGIVNITIKSDSPRLGDFSTLLLRLLAPL
ncbi:putative beta-adaptin protein [Trypanosoma vivax]|nr:putative beta-adaptin protein [Trypanosoma vivax]